MITRRLLTAGAALAPFAALAQGTAPAMPAPGRRAWAQQVPQIRIGLLGGENESDRLGRFEAYRTLLETTFGVPVRLFPAAD